MMALFPRTTVIAICLVPAPAVAAAPDAALFGTHCGICHGEMGTGTMMLGRRLGRDRALLDERTDLDAGYIRQVVRNGVGSMPPQTRVDLSDAELDRVAAYLTRPASERTPPHPAAPEHGHE
jgi:mono/diheme cytochrome c family protein